MILSIISNWCSVSSWHKPTRESLATQQYFEDYRHEQSLPDSAIQVYRGLGDSDFPELRGSLHDSILQKLSLSSREKIPGVDARSLLSQEEEDEQVSYL